MTAGIFDSIVLGFMSAIGGGIVSLQKYTLPILGFCALVAYCSTMWPLVLSNGEALGPVLLMAVRIGVYYWLCLAWQRSALPPLTPFWCGARPRVAVPSAGPAFSSHPQLLMWALPQPGPWKSS